MLIVEYQMQLLGDNQWILQYSVCKEYLDNLYNKNYLFE